MVLQPARVAATRRPNSGRSDRATDAAGRLNLAARAWSGLRSRPWLVAALASGFVVRLIALIAYRPGLEFSGDSYAYLSTADHLHLDIWHPDGYPLFLRLVEQTHMFLAIPLLQHLMGLTSGLLVYLLLRRLGVGDFGAAVAAGAFLLDAWQIAIEQFVLSEPLFELLLIGGAYVLLRRGLTMWAAAVGGALLAGAVLTRTVGVAPVLLILLLVALRRVGWRMIGAALAALVVPIGVYAGLFATRFGTFALTGLSGRQLYGEVAMVASCHGLPDTRVNRILCPKLPVDERPGNTPYVWSSHSPVLQLGPHARTDDHVRFGESRIAGRWADTVIRHQPLAYLGLVATTTAHYFEPGRIGWPTDPLQESMQFPATTDPPPPFVVDLARTGFGGRQMTPTLVRPLANFLRAYQRFVYVPGPALLAAVGLGLAGLVFGRGRFRRLHAGLFTLTGVAMLVEPSLVAGFDYRYLPPSLLFFPASAVLGWSALQPRLPAVVSGRSGLVRGVVVGAATIAVAVNGTQPSVLPASRQQPSYIAAMGSSVGLHDQLTVTVSHPRVVDVSCGRAPDGVPTLLRELAFYVHVYDGGGHRLVLPTNLFVFEPGRGPGRGGLHRPLTPLAERVLSRRHPNLAGWVGMWLPSSSGVVDYTDPTGAGTAGWRFDVHAPDEPPAGQACSLPPPVKTQT